MDSEKEKYILREEEIRADGAYHIQSKQGGAAFGPYDSVNLPKILKALKHPDVDAENSYITKYNKESKEIEYLVGTPEKPWGEVL